MISPDSLSIEWISSKAKEFKGDSIIVEKVIRALNLLESLQTENLEFIFKGGTALMLMIQEPRRFSIDIDILIENKDQDLEQILNAIIEKTAFVKWEEHKRKTVSEIEKCNFKKMSRRKNVCLLFCLCFFLAITVPLFWQRFEVIVVSQLI